MEWLVSSGIVAAVIIAAVTVWKTIYKSRSSRPTKHLNHAEARTEVTVNIGSMPQESPKEPPAVTLPTIAPPRTPPAGKPAAHRPALPTDPLDFAPVASTTRYQDLVGADEREESLMADLYRVSGSGLRVEEPDNDQGGERDR